VVERPLLVPAVVVSLDHEILVELFRHRPVLGQELLRACAGIALRGATAEKGSVDLSQVAPPEYRADSVVVLRDRNGEVVAAVIVEVQLAVDKDKLRAWPVYVAVARARLGCPVTLLVLAPDRAVARWARRPIRLGHPGYVLRPIVIGFEHVPRITDRAQARAAPELAVLSAIARPDAEVAAAARAALDLMSEEDQKLYWDYILARLSAEARQALEARMIKGYEYRSDFARKYYSQGLAKGESNGLRRAVIEIVGARLPRQLRLREELARRLRKQPEDVLVQLLTKLGKAPDKDGVRAVIDRFLERQSE
jgi:hypothetical protein